MLAASLMLLFSCLNFTFRRKLHLELDYFKDLEVASVQCC